MNDKEQEIQEAAEKGLEVPENAHDVQMYQLLYEGLKNEQIASAPAFAENFAKKVSERIVQEAAEKTMREEYIWKVAGFLAIISLSLFGLLYFSLFENIVSSFPAFKWSLLLAIALYIGIEYFDKRFVKKTV